MKREIWIPLVELAIYALLVHEYMTDDDSRSIFDVGIEVLVYVMPIHIIYGILRRRLQANRSRKNNG